MADVKPDLIKISINRRRTLKAESAELHVNIEGESFFTGDAALKKAKEVGALVAALTQNLLEPKAISLIGVRAKVKSGILGKSSSATYRLKIACEDLSRLPEILGIITAQKNTDLLGIEWKYKDEAAAYEQLLTDSLSAANTKARSVAAALGVRVTGVFSFNEKQADSEGIDFVKRDVPHTMRFKAKGPIIDEALGLDITHEKEIFVTADVEYRVSEIAAEPT